MPQCSSRLPTEPRPRPPLHLLFPIFRRSLQNGDTIRIDAETRSMDILNVDDAELQRRCAFPAWAEARPLGVLRGHDSRPRFCLVSLAWPPFGWSATYTSPSCRPTVWLQCRTTDVTPHLPLPAPQACRLDGAAAQGHQRHPVQVHQERGPRLHGLRHRRVTLQLPLSSSCTRAAAQVLNPVPAGASGGPALRPRTRRQLGPVPRRRHCAAVAEMQ